MRIRKIELLSNYKCFKKGTVFNFNDSPIICIIGKNSTGKTKFLEILDNIFNRIGGFPIAELDWKIEVKYKNEIYIISNNNNMLYFNNVSCSNGNVFYLDNNVFYSNNNMFYSNNNTSYFDNWIYNTPIFHKALRILNLSKKNENLFYRGDLKLDYQSLSAGEKNVINIFSLFQEKSNFFLKKEYLYLLDEPDKYLNNELKRKYISLLKEAISEDDQIIFTTHSTELISDLDEMQVYKCEDFEIKNINFNPFGQDSSVLTEKLFDDKFSISDVAKSTYDNYREKIKSASIYELRQLKNEIRTIFSDNIYRNELLELINNRLSFLK